MASPEDLVEIVRDDTTSVTVHLFGATVISWKHRGDELIFISSKSHFDNKKAIRGGIPVVFPNFGPWDLGPQHGFARIDRWQVEHAPKKDDDGNVSATFSLVDSEETRKMWDFKFKLLYKIVVQVDSVETHFSVINTDTKSFDFTCLLHTYFKVPEVRDVKVKGLKGITYVDKVRDGERVKEERDFVTISDNVDSVYENCSEDHIISNTIGSRTLCLKKCNFPDTVVWNPWVEKARGMADFGDDDYPYMICVEAGYVSSRKSLGAGEKFEASQTISCKL